MQCSRVTKQDFLYSWYGSCCIPGKWWHRVGLFVTDVYSYLCYGLCQGKIQLVVGDITDVKVKEHLLKVCFLLYLDPEHLKELFIYNPKSITASDLDQKFLPQFSPHGSNTREKEEVILLNWKDYIYEAKGITNKCLVTLIIKLLNRVWSQC